MPRSPRVEIAQDSILFLIEV